MKLNKMKKRFFSLNRHNSEGFTLVELIVVIAILAILAGVGVPVYSGYIKQANMQADRTLVSEVANALQLYYYSNPNAEAAGYVILSADGAEADAVNGFVDKAMDAAFGENWKTSVKLKYNKWPAAASKEIADAYLTSSFNGNETILLDRVGSLTNQMADVLEQELGAAGQGFLAYLEVLGLDENASAQEKANAALLYAASNTKPKEDGTSSINRDEVVAAFSTYYRNRELGTLQLKLSQQLGNFGACAAIYAQAEAFCQYIATADGGDATLLTEFHEKTDNINVKNAEGEIDSGAALEDIAGKFKWLVDKATTKYSELASRYVSDRADVDTKAYLATLQAINANEDHLKERLDMEGCYTDGTAAELLNSYLAAAAANANDGDIVVALKSNGTISVYPFAAVTN